MKHKAALLTIIACIVSIAYFCGSASAQEKEKGAEPVKAAADEPVKKAPGFWDTLFSLEPARERDPDEKRWFFTLGGWFERKMGNTNTMRTNGSALLEYKNGIVNFIVSYIQFYGENAGKKQENNGNGIIKYDHYLFPRVEYFIFSQVDNNQLIGLRLRNNTGTGLKFVFFKNKYWITDISAAPVFEYEKYTGRHRKYDFRASFRYRLKINIFGFLHLNGSVFYVPRVENFGQYRFIVDADATLSITRRVEETGGLLLKAGYLRSYNTYVLLGKKKLDDFLYAQVQLRL